jgi:sarcosine oxidase subunit gamma
MVESATRRGPAPKTAAWLKVLPPATRFSFNGDAAARAAVTPIWGAPFSEEACRAHVDSTRATLWLGPDEYLLLDTAVITTASTSTAATSAALFESLETALGDIPHALVDVSHRQFALEVAGPNATAILNGACPLDLDLSEFPVGMCTRTVLAKADIVLWRKREDVFHLEVWRSFAGYVSGILTEIAAGL